MEITKGTTAVLYGHGFWTMEVEKFAYFRVVQASLTNVFRNERIQTNFSAAEIPRLCWKEIYRFHLENGQGGTQ